MLESDLNTIDAAVQTSLSSLDTLAKSEVEEELAKLREEKSILEGKIRGYLTLSDICQEYKDELNRLKAEYQKLLAKVKQHEMKSDHLSHEPPTPDDDLGHANGCEPEQRKENANTENTENATTENTEARITPNLKETHTVHTEIYDKDRNVQTADLFEPVPDISDSSGGIKVIPESMSDKNEKDSKHSLSTKLDKYPMQESMAFSSHSQISLTGLGFENISDHMPLGESAGTLRKNPDDILFSGGTPEESNERTTKKKEEVIDLNEIISSLPIDSDESRRVADTVSKALDKRDQQIKKLKHMNEVLIEKSSQLQREKRELEKVNQRVLDKVRKLEKELYNISTSRSHSPQEGWVKVDKVTENEVQKASVDEIPKPKNSMDQLQEENKQLRDANQKWSTEWDKLAKHFEGRIKDLQTERDRIAKEISATKINEDAKQREYEKMIMNAKKKAGDEESAKEEALLQLTAANNRLDTLSSQVNELQEELTRTKRQKQSLETELNVVKEQVLGVVVNRVVERPVGSPASDRNVTELKNENTVLRHQLLIFQEDFDKERQDRATAQSLKDDLRKQNDSLKKKARHLETKNSSLERQLKASDDSLRRVQQDKDKLLQDLSEVKNELQRERENRVIYQPPQPVPVVQSAGFYRPQPQSPPQPQYFFGQHVMPQQHQHHPVIVPPDTQYQHRVSDYNRPEYVTVPRTQTQNRSPVYPTNQTGQETEMVAGAWACSQCTYKNYPGRTVCEMCGYIQNPSANQPQVRIGNGPLIPRGDENPMHPGYNVAVTRTSNGRN